ncbi:MAG: DMT family transporter [Nitrososphaeria archaeon]
MPSRAGNPTTIGYLSGIVAAALFGSIATVGKVTVSDVNPILLSCIGYAIATIVLTPFARRSNFRLERRDYMLIFVATLFSSVMATVLYFMGLQWTTASDTAILSNGEQVFTILFAVLFFHEKLKKIDYVAMMMILAGVFIVTTGLQPAHLLLEMTVGNLLVLLATMCWAVDNNVSKIMTERMNVVRYAQVKSTLSGLILAAVVLLLGIPLNVDSRQWPNIIFLGVVGYAASLYFFLQALKRIGTVKTILVFSTSAVFGLTFAVTFLKESMSVYQVVAIAIMMSGVYLMNKNDAR